MDAFQELKDNVFKVINDNLSLSDFELWLYPNEQLSMMMDVDSVLAAYEFSYNRPDSKYEFGKLFSSLFEEEFLLWKVKTNLTDLSNSTDRVDFIIKDFYKLGNSGYSWAFSIGYYEYLLDDDLYDYGDRNEILSELKVEAAQLLAEILDQEKMNPKFKLADFRLPKMEDLAVRPKFTAHFWK